MTDGNESCAYRWPRYITIKYQQKLFTYGANTITVLANYPAYALVASNTWFALYANQIFIDPYTVAYKHATQVTLMKILETIHLNYPWLLILFIIFSFTRQTMKYQINIMYIFLWLIRN